MPRNANPANAPSHGPHPHRRVAGIVLFVIGLISLFVALQRREPAAIEFPPRDAQLELELPSRTPGRMPWILASILASLAGVLLFVSGTPARPKGILVFGLKQRVRNFKTRRRFTTLNLKHDEEAQHHLSSIIGGSDGQKAPSIKALCLECRSPNDEGANFCNACGCALPTDHRGS